MIASRLRPFGTTIFSEMTRLAQEHGAINLAQGFPDFEGPEAIREAAVEALRGGHNQYARSMGTPELVRALAERTGDLYGLDYDPMTEVSVFSGATEGIAASLLGLLEPGDEIIVFEPFYDSYNAIARLAGATVRHCTLRFPDFALDADALAALFNERTRLLLLNSPHNPTGKVFSPDELAIIAGLCRLHDVWVVSDEVYEHLTFDGVPHVPIATLPGMRERTLTLSSSGKTYSYTGWKIGWALGPAPLVAAAQAAHQFLTFSTATPLQLAVANALKRFHHDYFATLRSEYEARRDLLLHTLRRAGFRPSVPQGTYFILADFSDLSEADDRTFARELIEKAGVAALPPSPFYEARPEEGRRLLRFAFCKKTETLQEAASRLERWRGL